MRCSRAPRAAVWRRAATLLAAAFAATRPALAAAQQVVAVLASELQPYRQALQGLEEELGHTVPVQILGNAAPGTPHDARVVVTFGSKAALQAYSAELTLVMCMAPGVRLADLPHTGRKIDVHMSPPADIVCTRLRELQPNLVRLAILWTSPAIGADLDAARDRVRALGIEVHAERLANAAALPDRLRSLAGHLDAVWLTPDPPLVDEQNFEVLKSFAETQRVPFYAPTAGLVTKGAVAAVASSFREIGRTAGRAVRAAQGGDADFHIAYPRAEQVTVNLAAAGLAGLDIPANALRNVDRVVR